MAGEVFAGYEQLAADGMTMVVVTHEIGFAREVKASRVIFGGGRLHVEEGTPEEVIDHRNKSTYHRLFEQVVL